MQAELLALKDQNRSLLSQLMPSPDALHMPEQQVCITIHAVHVICLRTPLAFAKAALHAPSSSTDIWHSKRQIERT